MAAIAPARPRLLRPVAAALAVLFVAAACSDGASDAGDPTTTVAPVATSGAPETTADTAPTTAATADTEPAPTTSTTVVDDASIHDLPANPLPVTYAPDPSAAVTVDIGPDGGVVTTTGSDGTAYTLTIPPGALFATEPITMTPVALSDSSIPGARMSGVVLEPDGLVLFEPATLEVTTGGLAADTAALFRAGHNGEDLHLVPGTIAATAVTTVPHFSSVGVLNAQVGEIFTIQDDYRPTAREGRYLQEIEVINRRVTDPEARNDAVADVLSDWIFEVAADAGRINDRAALDQLLGEFLSARDALAVAEATAGTELTAVRDNLAVAGEALQDATYRLFRQENLRCIQDREPEAVFAMLRWTFLYQWFEQQGWGTGDRLVEMDTAMRQCARFDFEYVSNAAGSRSGGGFSVRLEADVPLHFDTGEPVIHLLEGTFVAPLIEGTLNGAGSAGPLDCGTQAAIEVLLEFEIDVRFGLLDQSRITDQTVQVRFPVQENWTCAGQSLGPALWSPWWATAFEAIRDGEGFYTLTLTRAQQGDVYAVGNDARSSEGVDVTYTATLWHRPQLP
jgi:hypothetical protein